MNTTPTLRIVNSRLQEQPRMEKPQAAEYLGAYNDSSDYDAFEDAKDKYKAHLASLRSYPIGTTEGWPEVIGENDFELRRMFIWDDGEYKDVAFPKTGEQQKPLIKGEFMGLCNRTSCQKPPANYYNHSTRKYYCSECAMILNHENKKDAYRIFGHELCTEGYSLALSQNEADLSRLTAENERLRELLKQMHTMYNREVMFPGQIVSAWDKFKIDNNL